MENPGTVLECLESIKRSMRWLLSRGGSPKNKAAFLTDFLLREKPEFILELGCGIGTSACYKILSILHQH